MTGPPPGSSLSHPPVLRVLAGMDGDGPRRFTRDAAGFDALYEAFHARVYGFLYRLAGRRDVSDDLFQEAWLRLARSWARLEPSADAEAWLFTIARNVFVSHLRADATKQRAAEQLRRLPTQPHPQPDHAVQASEGVALIDRAFAALSHDDREVLWLVAVEGLAQDQVAQVLGLSHAAVRQRVSRARARLAALLDGEQEASAPTPQLGGEGPRP